MFYTSAKPVIFQTAPDGTKLFRPLQFLGASYVVVSSEQEKLIRSRIGLCVVAVIFLVSLPSLILGPWLSSLVSEIIVKDLMLLVFSVLIPFPSILLGVHMMGRYLVQKLNLVEYKD